MKASKQKQSILIGPLPPPWGGARVSFQLFHDYLYANKSVTFRHFDMPCRYNHDKSPPGPVNHRKTLLSLGSVLKMIPSAKFVTIFGSRGFCFSYGLIILIFSKFFRKRCYVRFFGGRPMLMFTNRSVIVRAISLFLLSKADGISLETKAGAEEFPLNIQKKIIVIPGYRPSFDVTLKRKKNNAIRFVYIGGITALKGMEVLATAYIKLRENLSQVVELHLYGSGPPNIVQLFQEVPGVHYHGKEKNEVLRCHLPSYDVFVFPSMHESEGHPGVLIEAFMAKLPIITTSMPCINEMVINGGNGLVIEPGAADQLAEAMRKLTVDTTLRAKLSTGAEQASHSYDAKNVLPKLKQALGWS